MKVYTGNNYVFFADFADGEKLLFEHSIAPFYSFTPQKIPKLPAVYSESIAIPGFLYRLRWQGGQNKPQPIHLDEYIHLEDNRIFQKHSHFGPNSYLHFSGGKQALKRANVLVGSELPLLVQRDELATQIGATMQSPLKLAFRERRPVATASYLSLKDMVNPELSAEEVYIAIDDLALAGPYKKGLKRLYKILYAAKSEGEVLIMKNIHAQEPAFSRLLYDALYNVEIIPIIHGPFLQDIVSSLSDEDIARGIRELSKPLRATFARSISKNRMNHILDLPAKAVPKKKKTKSGAVVEETIRDLHDILLEAIADKFIRQILYEPIENETPAIDTPDTKAPKTKKTRIYRIPLEQEVWPTVEVPFVNSFFINFSCRPLSMRFLAFDGSTVYLQAITSVEYFRADTWWNNYEHSFEEYLNIRKGTILGIEIEQRAKAVIGGGISSGGFPFEIQLIFREI